MPVSFPPSEAHTKHSLQATMTAAPKNKKNQKVSLVYRSRMPLMIPLSRSSLAASSSALPSQLVRTPPAPLLLARIFVGHLIFFSPFGEDRGVGHGICATAQCHLCFVQTLRLSSFKSLSGATGLWYITTRNARYIYFGLLDRLKILIK